MRPLRELCQPHIRALVPYTPGLQPSGSGWIKLNTNELPFPPPPEVHAAIAAEIARLPRYPDPRSTALREALAAFHGLAPAQVIVGNGSDDLLNLLARAFGGAGRVTVETFPSYSLYPVITAMAGGAICSVPLGEGFSLPLEALAAAHADLLFLTCPNAPTGVRFPLDQLRELARRCTGLLVIDEAYAEFARESAIGLLAGSPNVVVTRTFSKAFGLAGLRVGYAMADPEVVAILDRIRDSYNVNRLSQAGALAALGAWPYYAERIREIVATRDRLRAALLSLGWQVPPSEANFLFAEPVRAGGSPGADVAAELYRHLEARRILVRHFAKHPLTAPFLRISIGSRSEMDTLLTEVTAWSSPA